MKGSISTYNVPPAPPAEATPSESASVGPAAVVPPSAGGATGADSEGVAPAPTAAAAESQLQRAQRVAKAAKAQAARNRDMMAAKAASDAKAAQWEQRAARAEQERAEAGRLRERLQDPEQRFQALREAGITAEEIARRAIAEQAPDAEVRRALAKVEQLEQKLQERLQQDERERVTRGAQRAQRAFASEATALGADGAPVYAWSSQQPPEVLLSAVDRIVQRIPQEKRASVTNADLLQYLEWQYTNHAKAKTASSKTPAKETSVASQESATGSQTPRTLTNGSAAASYSRPKNWDQLTETQKRAESVRLLEGMKKPAK